MLRALIALARTRDAVRIAAPIRTTSRCPTPATSCPTAPPRSRSVASEPELARDVLSLAVDDDTPDEAAAVHAGRDRTQARRARRTAAVSRRRHPRLRKGVEVSVGPASASVFTGRISGIELAMQQGRDPEVRVFAEDKLMDLRMTRRFRRPTRTRRRRPRRADRRTAWTARAVMPHAKPSDRAAMERDRSRVPARARTRRRGRLARRSTLHIATRDRRRQTAQRITLIQGNDLLAVEIRADLAEQRTARHVGGYDETGKDGIDEEAPRSLTPGEAGGGRNGPEMLNRRFRRSRELPRARRAVRRRRGARWSHAALLPRGRRFVTARGITLGTPELRVGSWSNCSGWGRSRAAATT